MKEINKILPIVSLIFTVILAGFAILLYKEIEDIKETTTKPTICVPLVKENFYGDYYFLKCSNTEEFIESIEKVDSPEI